MSQANGSVLYIIHPKLNRAKCMNLDESKPSADRLLQCVDKCVIFIIAVFYIAHTINDVSPCFTNV